MYNTGGGSFTRNRRLESFLDTNSTSNGKQTPKILVREEVVKSPTSDVYVEDDGWISALISCVKIVGSVIKRFNLQVFIQNIAFCSRTEFMQNENLMKNIIYNARRIHCGRLNEQALNLVEENVNELLMWILKNPIRIEGTEFSNERAVYVCNHASPIDIFLMMWLTPTGTVGIAKKEIIWYPLFGQIYVLANHLRIDRSNPTAAIQSMKEVAHAVVKNNLSLAIFPEGTRSKNGRLLPFKKGFVHLALQTRLPIVPVVLTGTHHAWRNGGLRVQPAPITVKYLRPIKTDDWTEDKVNDYVRLLHDIYVENLPEAQRPLH
ncbi:hypothetical protein POTOM_040044 [Populus tomentosa]|uniref:1-acyl-sn-glycerol-3-phosphate acyltransferase n=1 Tax=Populus tomentosa TaxID=118781 RepID=A0A8X8CK15_POPTO|nr:hypothetical protein POTOM_040044 [Populus tomentosa]